MPDMLIAWRTFNKMKKTIVLFSFTLIALGLSSVVRADDTEPVFSLKKDAFTSQYVTVLRDENVLMDVCSGFGVKDGNEIFLITAKHCADLATKLRFWSYPKAELWQVENPEKIKPSFINTDSHDLQYDPYFARDIFVSKIKQQDLPSDLYLFETIRSTPLAENELLYVDGYGGNSGKSRLKCKFAGMSLRPAIAKPDENALYYQDLSLYGSMVCRVLSGKANHVTGFSGGPVFDTSHRLVGVLNAALSNADNMLSWNQNAHVLFGPVVGNKISRFSKEFCGVKTPSNLETFDLCQNDGSFFKPTENQINSIPLMTASDLESVSSDLKTEISNMLLSVCRKSDLSTVRLISSKKVTMVSAPAKRYTGESMVDLGGRNSNFESSAANSSSKKFEDFKSAYQAFQKACVE